jgi:PASTA domain
LAEHAEPEIALLVAASESGVAGELALVRGVGLAPDEIEALTQRLADERGFATRDARWAVDTWAWALDLPDPMAGSASHTAAGALEVLRPRRGPLSVAALAFLVALVGAIAIVAFLPNAPVVTDPNPGRVAPAAVRTATIRVPSFVGGLREDAVDRLRAIGLTALVSVEETTGAEPGTVLEQDPAPGRSVDEGTPVRLVVALPPERVRVPTGLSFDVSTTSVALTWDVSESGSKIDHYEIWRDGEKIAERTAAGRAFTDHDLSPGGTYHYGVVAVGENDTRAFSHSRSITLPSPPSPSPSPEPDTSNNVEPPPPPPPPPPPEPCTAPDPDFCD